MKQLKLREGQHLAQGHTAVVPESGFKWSDPDLSLSPKGLSSSRKEQGSPSPF